MTLNKTGKLYRFAYYFMEPWEHPNQTTLCAFFWRTFVFIPLLWLIIATISIGIATAVLYFGVYKSKGLGVLAAGTIILAWYLVGKYDIRICQSGHLAFLCLKKSVFVQGLLATKKKFCPIIWFE